MLPDGDALEIVTALGQLPDRPAIIMLTAKDAKEDVIDGLNSGADDYLGRYSRRESSDSEQVVRAISFPGA